MEHLAIMRKSWGLTEKILQGKKIIESRWYKTKYRPWSQIEAGQTIYFKDCGDPVSIKAQVKNVLQFSDLTQEKVAKILKKYGKGDGIGEKDIAKYFEMFKDKKYCMLIFLKNPQKVEPFLINKKGFGSMASWIIVRDINEIKVRSS